MTGPAKSSISGLVIDSGDGATQLIPVYDGYPILSQATQLPLAGKDCDFFVTSLLRSREKIPAGIAFEIARKYKEDQFYICSDPVKEFAKYDANPEKYFGMAEYKASDGKTYKFQTGHEKFMAGEFFFNPDVIFYLFSFLDSNFALSKTLNPDYTKSLSSLIVETVYKCPMDTRRALLKNISISGGSTMFKNFDKRLEKEVKNELHTVLAGNNKQGGQVANIPEVIIPKDKHQKYRVFAGAAVMANQVLFL